jgi:hypothetical protein
MAAAAIRVDLRLIQQLRVNLLDNVALHMPPGTRGQVRWPRSGGASACSPAKLRRQSSITMICDQWRVPLA